MAVVMVVAVAELAVTTADWCDAVQQGRQEILASNFFNFNLPKEMPKHSLVGEWLKVCSSTTNLWIQSGKNGT